MKKINIAPAILLLALLVTCQSRLFSQTVHALVEFQLMDTHGAYGGKLTSSLRSDPKTFNPLVAVDASSQEIIGQLNADLVHISRATQKVEPALAKSWEVSRDGLTYTFHLRHGVRFSDDTPFDADDVVSSFALYQNEKLDSPQRDILAVGGKPLVVEKIDSYTVKVRIASPCASGDRLFDGVSILPHRRLDGISGAGIQASQWSSSSPPSEIAGLGPFRLKEYKPGQYVTLERNPHYWKIDKQGHQLPYLSELTFLIVANEDAEVVRFAGGETDVINRVGAANFISLKSESKSKAVRLMNLGSSLEYNFLLFNLNSVVPGVGLTAKQSWFNNLAFRRAVSYAIDREGMAQIVYRGMGMPLWSHMTPGNTQWNLAQTELPQRSIAKARELLQAAGFSWRDGNLTAPSGSPVDFTIIASASSPERIQMATLIQQDLSELGIQAHVAPLDFHSLLDRVLHTHDYEVAVMGLGRGDTDPNSQMNVWMSTGDMHLWNIGSNKPAGWELEMNSLLTRQFTTLDLAKRKEIYRRALALESQNLPIICLVSPDVLVGARAKVMNFRPAVLDSHTLWNSEELYLDSAKVRQ